MHRLFIFLVGMDFCSYAFAEIPDKEKYDQYFEIDLNTELPTYEELQKSYTDHHTVYDRKYKWHWDIGNLFDAAFRSTISIYGGTERRVKAKHEDTLLQTLKILPPEYYQYIGPYLHTVPGMSEKILNLPGIKETKNKFPTRIAKHLENVEDLEFISPHFYFLLMPEIWGEDTPREDEQPQKIVPLKKERNTKLYDTVRKMVPAEEFYPSEVSKPKDYLSDLRTIHITENSPLTSGDIKAFLKTIPVLNELQKNDHAMAKIYSAGTLLDVWDMDNGRGLPINTLKDLIYPCRRLVQKMRIAGEDVYLRHIVAQEGFTPESWAYTCDKTLAAYRMATMNHGVSQSLKGYVLGANEKELQSTLNAEAAEMVRLEMQAAMRLFYAPRSDVLEAYKNRELLRDSFYKAGYSIIAAPIVVSN